MMRKSNQRTQGLSSFWEVTGIAGFFLLWRGLLLIVAKYAHLFLPDSPIYHSPALEFERYQVPDWIYRWAYFDGFHYVSIAENGYIYSLTQAFFPFFPFVILRSLKLYFGNSMNTLVWGLLFSNLCAVLLSVVWFYFVKQRFGQRSAVVATLLLFLFPTSFFFGALYTESLFLLVVLLAFIFAEKKQWMLAAVFTIIATATRLVGIFLIPALVVEWWFQQKEKDALFPFPIKKDSFIPLIWIAAGSLGLLGYMLFLQQNFHDPLYFFHVQSEFHAGRQESLVLYPQVVWRSIRILWTARPIDWKYFTYVNEFLAGAIGVATLAFAAWKERRIKPSYSVFALGTALLPTFTGTFSSMPRYILVSFPLILFLTFFVQKWPKLGIVWILLSTVLMLINTILFIQGYWVA